MEDLWKKTGVERKRGLRDRESEKETVCTDDFYHCACVGEADLLFYL